MPHKPTLRTYGYLLTAPFVSKDDIPARHHVGMMGWSNRGLMVSPPPVLFKDKVMLRSHPKFLPTFSSDFHFNQPIHLPVFHSNHIHPGHTAAHPGCQESSGLLSTENQALQKDQQVICFTSRQIKRVSNL